MFDFILLIIAKKANKKPQRYLPGSKDPTFFIEKPFPVRKVLLQ